MLGSEYKWLLAPVQSTAVERAHLARRSFLTLAVATFCVVCALVQPASSLSSAATVATPVVAKLDETAAEWPHALVRLWFLLPQLLPTQGN